MSFHGSIILLLLAFASSCTSTASNTTNFAFESRNLKILAVFGFPGKSHFMFFQPLVEELARRGHEVTVISHFPRTAKAKAEEPLPTYRDISVYNESTGLVLNVFNLDNVNDAVYKWFYDMIQLRALSSMTCNTVLRSPAVHEFLRSGEKFDLLIMESFSTDCCLSIVAHFDAPFIYLSSHQIMPWTNDRLGNPQESSYIMCLFSNLKWPMDFIGRMINTVTVYLSILMYNTWFLWEDQAIVNEIFGPKIPNLAEIDQNATALLVNTHFALHGSRSLLPNVIEVGGLHIPKKRKPLPKDIKEFLDEAHEGVLYFNLGSVVKTSSMTKEKLDIILNVISSLPRKVIWKWEVEKLPYKPKNLMVKKWLPQFEIMGHPNVKCYMGHGGLLGLSEASYHGLPMILMPSFGDQPQNAQVAKGRGMAIILRYRHLSEKILRDALDEIFNNTRYHENARKVSKAYRDRPASPLETAVWWTEYIARGNGLPYLESKRRNLSWYHRHLVDVAIFLLIASLVVLYALYRIVKLALGLSSILNGEETRERRGGGSKKRD